MRARGNCTICFRRMIEQLLWELHCPRDLCRAAVKFAVDEIGAPAEEQPDGAVTTRLSPRFVHEIL